MLASSNPWGVARRAVKDVVEVRIPQRRGLVLYRRSAGRDVNDECGAGGTEEVGAHAVNSKRRQKGTLVFRKTRTTVCTVKCFTTNASCK
jgi:hypothetical protein